MPLPLESFLSPKGCDCWSWKHYKITMLMIREGGDGWMASWKRRICSRVLKPGSA